MQPQNRTPITLCISSGKGGVGKTSLSVNFAFALAHKSKKVLLIDGDLGLANIDVLLGLQVSHNIEEAIKGDKAPANLLVPIVPDLHVLPASSGAPQLATLSQEKQNSLKGILDTVADGFDFVIIDSAAGIGESVLWFNNWARKNVIIISPDPTSLTDAYALIKVLYKRDGKKIFYLLINNAKSKKEGLDIFNKLSLVVDKFLGFTPKIFGVVPQDSNVVRAIRNQKPFLLHTPESRASRAVKSLTTTFLQNL